MSDEHNSITATIAEQLAQLGPGPAAQLRARLRELLQQKHDAVHAMILELGQRLDEIEEATRAVDGHAIVVREAWGAVSGIVGKLDEMFYEDAVISAKL